MNTYKQLSQEKKDLIKKKLSDYANSYTKKKVDKQTLHQIAKKIKTKDIQPGDYVQLEGSDVRNLADATKILAMMKEKMNILYVYKVTPDGMVTLTPRRTQTSRKIQVPRSLIRYKLVNVDEEYQ